MLERKNKRTAKIGVFGVAHPVYWAQFPGLFETLMGYHDDFIIILSKNDVEIIDYGMIDSNTKAYNAVKKILADDIDVLMCNMLTYATSSVFAPIVRDTRQPIVLTALQPRDTFDLENGSTRLQLENDNICSVPEFTGVALRMGKKVNDVIIGCLYNDLAVNEAIAEWCDIAKVLHDLRGARFGLMGHVLESMYDMHADPTAISAAFDVHVPLLEVDDLKAEYDKVTDAEINEQKAIILDYFEMPDPGSDSIASKLTESDLYKAAKAAAALSRFTDVWQLDGLAYYYNALPASEIQAMISSLIVGNSILNARGIPMCGEFDIKTCVAMFIMDRLNIGGSFAEFHPIDFREDYILIGHDGPHHIAVADGKPILRSLNKYHGKPGSGASVEFKLKEGPITMLGITQNGEGKLKFVIGEGLSVKGPIPPTGNTNTRGRFEPDTCTFIKKWVMAGPTHHYALGLGHKADTIAKIAEILGIEYEIIRG